MQVLRILTYPDPLLREVADPVDTTEEGWYEKWASFRGELVKAMYAYDGVAIAAPQVGAKIRMIAIDLRPDTEEGRKLRRIPLVMTNPRIVRLGDSGIESVDGALRVTQTEETTEGCLSFPGVMVMVERYLTVSASWISPDGKEVEQTFTGLQARAIQHELEHLDGKLLIDHVTSRLRREMVERRMARVNKRGGARPRGLRDRSAPDLVLK